MIQLRTQTMNYWGPGFALTDVDIEHISGHFLEVEKPQTAYQLACVVIAHRVAEEKSQIQHLLSGRTIYQPRHSFKVDDELVFPALEFAHGKVAHIREGYNPQYGKFNVIKVNIEGKTQEFAADLPVDHSLNVDNGDAVAHLIDVDLDSLYNQFASIVEAKLTTILTKSDDFVQLGEFWFMNALMIEINVGHLHLSEALLEMHEGGPLSADEIIPHLDMDSSINREVQHFSLNHALLKDNRFDEIAPKGKVLWFLHRLEPEAVKTPPPRLLYRPISYDRALLSPQLMLLEREIDDEWSDIEPMSMVHSVVFTLNYPHRLCGTIPLSARIRPLFPLSSSPRQRVVFIDEYTNEPITGWIVQEHRYIYGLEAWYAENNIPIGGFVHLKPGPESGVVMLGYDRRRPQREWMRLATVTDNRLQFELHRRSISCGYDDLLIVGTDVVAAVDALWRRAETNHRSVASLLAEIFPQLADLAPQKTVHAKTLYSAINMLRRLPPGPLFAELVRHPAFQSVGDHYWRFESSRWRESR